MILILYSILFSAIISAIYISKYPQKRDFFLVIFGIILVVFITFRNGDRLPDYQAYVELYNSNKYSIDQEFSFYLISISIKNLFNNIYFLFFVYAVLGVTLKFKAIKQLSEFWFLSICLYISSYFILHDMIQIRAGVASGFLLLAIKPIYDRNLKKFLLYCILAFIFHRSAIIFLPFWFLNAQKFNKIAYISTLGFAYLFYLFHFSVIPLIRLIPLPFIDRSLNKALIMIGTSSQFGTFVNVFNPYQLAMIALIIFLTIKLDIINKKTPHAIITVKILYISLIIYALIYDIPVIPSRVAELLQLILIIVIPYLIYTIKQKRIGYMLVSLLSVLWMTYFIFRINLIK